MIITQNTAVTNHKKTIMKFFPMQNNQHYKIMKVESEDIAAFRKKYQRGIILESDSSLNCW